MVCAVPSPYNLEFGNPTSVSEIKHRSTVLVSRHGQNESRDLSDSWDKGGKIVSSYVRVS